MSDRPPAPPARTPTPRRRTPRPAPPCVPASSKPPQVDLQRKLRRPARKADRPEREIRALVLDDRLSRDVLPEVRRDDRVLVLGRALVALLLGPRRQLERPRERVLVGDV